MIDLGQAGENLVSAWLQQQGWHILHRRWRVKQGEIDLIAGDRRQQSLIFVEVKTRSGGNWDQGGLGAVSGQKQQKLWQTAQYFLAKYPRWGEVPCRFDVALVFSHGPVNTDQGVSPTTPGPITLGQPLLWQGYQLCLQQYLTNAFGG